MLEEVLARVRGARRLLLDTNLLLALVVWRYDRRLIGQKRVKEFRPEEMELLEAIVGQAGRLFTTTPILTEVSNLLGHLGGERAAGARRVLSAWLARADEHHEVSSGVMRRPQYPRLGLTDAGIIEAVTTQDFALTADLDLALELAPVGRPVVNFNHIRQLV